MKYNIVFSIPIHEKLEVVIDQIINFFYFNQNCAIVFHISQGFNYKQSGLSLEEFKERIAQIGNVYINPESVRTGRDDIIQAHLSNFKFVYSFLEFDFFSLCASNELFLKGGLYNHIKIYDCGVEFMDVTAVSNREWISGLKALKDDDLIKYIDRKGGGKIYGSHVEGSFYKKELFFDIVTEIESFYNYKEMPFAYPRDEVYFSTVTWIINQKKHPLKIHKNGLFSWSRWKSLLDLKVWAWDISRLEKVSSVFSVKRVDRDINANLRMYIRQRYGYLHEVSQYVQSAEARNRITTYFYDTLDYLHEMIKKVYRVIRIAYRRRTGYYEKIKSI